MVGKHADLPIHKLVLVSSSGFTAEARAKAAAHDIEALSVIEAEKKDWVGWLCDVQTLRFAGFTLTAEQVSATVATTPDFRAESSIHPETLIQEPGATHSRILKDQVQGILRNDKVFLPATGRWLQINPQDRPTSFSFQVMWACQPGTRLQLLSGEVLPLKQLVLRVRAEIQDAPLLAKASKFRQRNVVHAQVPDLLTGTTSNLLVTLLEKDGKLEKGAALLVGADPNETQVLKMKFPPSDEIN